MDRCTGGSTYRNGVIMRIKEIGQISGQVEGTAVSIICNAWGNQYSHGKSIALKELFKTMGKELLLFIFSHLLQ